ncbi:MAG TPA: DinB family protein [Nocardioides sp.]|uniref:DinB family protein n=1 Tax=Nocardioides sp. TaxID=35761 RepID=UPI002E31F650|nr:DinB family protein [Nocardioides sp.]HEX5089156.1 DinB family protein [Nocardioides sp.]
MSAPEPSAPPTNELDSIRRWLADLRASVERKSDGLSPEQLAARSVPPSSLSVLGLVRHLAQMEHFWFVKTLSRSDEPQLYVEDGDWDAQFRGAVADQAVVDDAFATWRSVQARADEVLDHLDASDLNFVWDPEDRIGSVRDVLLQVVYEYSRHCGHLDLLREAIDGRTGE